MKKSFKFALGFGALVNVGCGDDMSLEGEAPATVEEAAPKPRSMADDLSAVPEEIVEREYVRTPFGRAHPSCMHRVADGERVDEDGVVQAGERVVGHVPACDYAPEIGASRQVLPDVHSSSWVTDAFIDAPNRNGFQMFNYSSSSVQVPPQPRVNSGQVFYTFPAFMTPELTHLLQPVLQWGPDSTGGGAYWSISSWAIIGSGSSRRVLNTDKAQVAPGEWLSMNMQVIAEIIIFGVKRYVVRISVTASGGASKSIDVTVAPTALRRLYLGASEIWNETTCDNLPNLLSYNTRAYTPNTTPWNTYLDVLVVETEENRWGGTCQTSVNAFLKSPSNYQVDMRAGRTPATPMPQ